jgi:hypothetical protein
MRKFAANYLVSDAGKFLKNGIVIATEEGEAVEFIEPGDDLREIAQLIFFNGILITNCRFVRSISDFIDNNSAGPLESLIIQSTSGLHEMTIQQVFETGMKVQLQFPEMTIPQILDEISNGLLKNGRFSRMNVPGIYLLSGVNLPELKFTPGSKLKKLL